MIVAGRVNGARDAAAGKQIFDLADRDDRNARVRQTIEQRRRERRQREVAAVGGPLERARHADERPRDHAADAVADARPARTRSRRYRYSSGTGTTSSCAAI